MTDLTMIDGIDYGPLATLAGSWQGDKGVDKAPEPEGEEKNLYYETLLFEPIGDVTNAEIQVLSVLRYHQVVSRKTNDQVFHNETGYLSWDPASGVIMQSFSIPRGVAVLAGGKADTSGENELMIEVNAVADEGDWGIVQSPFMKDKAKTVSFSHSITVNGDELVYVESTVVDIYGKVFDHTDRNRLTRV
ncbi:MAG: heme-binding beta-barrel domain-containing protein [Pseudomonadales bacterium]